MRQLLTQRNTPGLGITTLGSLSVGMVMRALEIAAQAEESDQPAAFANSILAVMLVDPPKTPEEVASLPADVVTDLVEIAAGKLGIRMEFDSTSADLPARERLYQAYLEHQRFLLAGLRASTSELIASVGESWRHSLEQIYGRVGEALAQAAIPVDMLASINDSFQRMAALNLKLASPLLDISLLSEQWLRQIQEVVSRQEDISRLTAEPLQALVAELGRVKPPEPFLSDALLASGLNSPLLHSPTYTPLEIELPRTVEEIETRAEDAERHRLVDAYDILSQLEQSLREIIEARLREVHGDHWWKRGVPEAVRRGCEERKQAKEKPLETLHHPIYYAYVDDYKTIIVRRNNWRAAFATVFGNKTELEASFAWVGRVRDSIAHVRPVSDDDYLWFVAGAHWLHVAIARAQGSDMGGC